MVWEGELATRETVKEDGLNVWFHSGKEGIEPEFDLILVQGLGAHPYYTWLGKKDDSTFRRSRSIWRAFKAQDAAPAESDLFWPRDLLPRHFPSSRVATYSYTSGWTSRKYRTDIRRCAEQLLIHLRQSRSEDQARGRPLVFVGHSLGGLVIQQALTIAVHGTEFEDIHESAAGAIFPGSPMQGCDVAYIGALLQKIQGIDQTLLKTLQSGSEHLLSLSRDFWQSYNGVPMMCFYEEEPSFHGSLTVKPQSASLVGKPIAFLKADHSQLNKFWGDDDGNFQLFVGEMRHICKHTMKNKKGVVVNKGKTQDIQLIPSHNVPFNRDSAFVEPGDLLLQIDFKCSVPASRTAIVGLGGIGKSQLVIEYAFRVRHRSPDTWVLWIYGSNEARFKESLRNIAETLQLPYCENPNADLPQLVFDWLRAERNGKWLLIIDNVDDATFLFDLRRDNQSRDGQNSTQRLIDYFPYRQNGSILITSRFSQEARKIVEEKDIIQVEPMQEAHAIQLLQNKLNREGDPADVAALATALDFMPLAMVQAASYINQRHPFCSIQGYLKRFSENDTKKESLLNFDAGHLRRDREAKNSIILAWQITFDHIREIRPSAVILLSLMSFFDRQGIPETILREHSPNCKDEEGFEEDVLILRDFSLITVMDPTNFGMHRLVQFTTQKWLQMHNQFEEWSDMFIIALFSQYRNLADTMESIAMRKQLLPHVKSAMSLRPRKKSPRLALASLMTENSVFASFMQMFSEGEAMALKAINIYEETGRKHDSERVSIRCLSSRYQDMHRYEKAEQLARKTLEERQRTLGVAHPETLRAVCSLAHEYQNQGQHAKAENILREVMNQKLSCSKLRSEIVCQLVLTLRRQRKWDEAETALRTAYSTLGSFQVKYELASIYIEQGNFKEAEESLEEMRNDEALGTDKLNQIWYNLLLAHVYWGQKPRKLNESIRLKETVVRDLSEALGERHPFTVTAVELLKTYQAESLAETA